MSSHSILDLPAPGTRPWFPPITLPAPFCILPWMRPCGTCCWAVRPFLYIWYKSCASDSQLVTHRGLLYPCLPA